MDGGPADRPAEGRDGKPRFVSAEARLARMNRRRDRIADEIERNRRGENAVPTWVLTVILVLLIAGVAILVAMG